MWHTFEWAIGVGIYSEYYGEISLGGTAVISGNINNDVYLADGQYITLSISTPLAPGMHVGVRTESEDDVIVNSGANPGDEAYFFVKGSGRKVSYESGKLRIIEAAPNFQISGYTIVERVRSGMTAYDITAKIRVTNNGGNAKNVRAVLAGWQPEITVVFDSELSFGDIPAGATVTSEDTLKFRLDKTLLVDESQLVFVFDEVAPDFQISGYTIVERVRSGMTAYDITAKICVTNNGGNAENVRAILTGWQPEITVVFDSELSFGDIPAGATVTSEDALKFRLDKTLLVDESQLVFVFDEVAPDF